MSAKCVGNSDGCGGSWRPRNGQHCPARTWGVTAMETGTTLEIFGQGISARCGARADVL